MESQSTELGSVLVFGGCGFLGQHIVKHLSACPDVSKITVFDINTSPKNPIPGVDYVTGSISSLQDVDAAFNHSRPKVLFHTASPGPFSKNMKLFEEVNVSGTENILKCAQKYDFTKAFIYTSSSSVIHDNRSDLVRATEDAPVIFMPQQTEFYSHTKAVAETMLLSANRNGIRTMAIRPAGLFGEGDTGTVTSVILNAREGKGKIQIGDNTNVFDWTYVGNNAHAQIIAARALLRSYFEPVPNDTKVDGEAIAITNDDPWPFWDFTRALAAAGGYPIKKEEVIVLPWRVMMVFAWTAEWVFWVFTFGRKEPRLNQARVKYTTMTRTLDITKAKSRLGYRPQVSMQDGIEKAAKWFLEENLEAKKNS